MTFDVFALIKQAEDEQTAPGQPYAGQGAGTNFAAGAAVGGGAIGGAAVAHHMMGRQPNAIKPDGPPKHLEVKSAPAANPAASDEAMKVAPNKGNAAVAAAAPKLAPQTPAAPKAPATGAHAHFAAQQASMKANVQARQTPSLTHAIPAAPVSHQEAAGSAFNHFANANARMHQQTMGGQFSLDKTGPNQQFNTAPGASTPTPHVEGQFHQAVDATHAPAAPAQPPANHAPAPVASPHPNAPLSPSRQAYANYTAPQMPPDPGAPHGAVHPNQAGAPQGLHNIPGQDWHTPAATPAAAPHAGGRMPDGQSAGINERLGAAKGRMAQRAEQAAVPKPGVMSHVKDFASKALNLAKTFGKRATLDLSQLDDLALLKRAFQIQRAELSESSLNGLFKQSSLDDRRAALDFLDGELIDLVTKASARKVEHDPRGEALVTALWKKASGYDHLSGFDPSHPMHMSVIRAGLVDIKNAGLKRWLDAPVYTKTACQQDIDAMVPVMIAADLFLKQAALGIAAIGAGAGAAAGALNGAFEKTDENHSRLGNMARWGAAGAVTGPALLGVVHAHSMMTEGALKKGLGRVGRGLANVADVF